MYYTWGMNVSVNHAVNYYPAADLSDFELGLINFKTYYTIPNVNSNNKFYFDKDDKKIVIPEEFYATHNIDKWNVISDVIMKKKTLRKNEDDERVSADNSRQQQYDEEWDQMHLSDKYHQILQH